MSKVCINCGREMSRLDKSIKLVFAESHLCRNCSEEAEDMLHYLNVADTQFGFKPIDEKFNKMLDNSSYSIQIRSMIHDDFNLWKSNTNNAKLVVTKYFKADYEDCCDKIFNIGKTIANNVHSVDSIQVGGVQTTSFILERYYARIDHYTTLTVNLTSYNHVCVITTICTGADSLGLGIEKDFQGLFWNTLRNNYKQWLSREIDRDEADGLNHNKIGIL